MGADLIAYTVIGPRKLNPSKALQKKILAHAANVIGAAKQFQKDPDFDWGEDRFIKSFDVEELDEIAVLDAEQVLSDLLALWDGGYGIRDATSRTVTIEGKKYLIVTAGERTWGDEPDGTGYCALRDSSRLGMLDLLGVQ